MENSSHVYGVEKRLNANTFISTTGHGFAGWALESTGTVRFEDQQNVKNLTDKDGAIVTLYAIWGHFYTVAYDANGGSGVMLDSEFIYHKPMALRGNLFTLTGHSFSGWATSPSSSIIYKNEQIVVNLAETAGEKITLYAIWGNNQNVRRQISRVFPEILV
jgi:hypothetical protein